jgi:hypothetical protein
VNKLLTGEEMKEISKGIEAVKGAVRKARKEKHTCIDATKQHNDAHGCPIEGVIAQVEMAMTKYGAKCEAYHGGDFNGISCQKVGANIIAIMTEIEVIFIREKDPLCSDEEATNMMDGYLYVCGLVNAVWPTMC